MTARALMTALLVWGVTASVACEAFCAHAAADTARPAASPASEVTPCHGHGLPAPDPVPIGPAAPDATPCCPDLLAAADSAVDPDTVHPMAVLAPPAGQIESPLSLVSARAPSRPRRLNSAFLYQNPPLLS